MSTDQHLEGMRQWADIALEARAKVESLTAELQAEKRKVAEMEPRCAFGDQCWQDQCEGALIEQTVVDRIRKERDAEKQRADRLAAELGSCMLSLKAARGAYDAQSGHHDSLRAELAQAREALRAVEWVGRGNYSPKCCPVCVKEPSEGHSPDCIVGKALPTSP